MKYQDKDEYYMMLCLKEAKKSLKSEDVPVGCIIVEDDKIIARAHNTREKLKNALNHAEINAINKACKKKNSWILDNATLYVTLEPCTMCAGAILQARIKRLVFATFEPKHGAVCSINNVLDKKELNHHVEITSGILKDEAAILLKDFFKRIRTKKE